MSKLKFVQITSFSQSDVSDLFKFICEEILHKAPGKVKLEVNSATGNTCFKNTDPTSFDLLQTISVYDIDFKLELKYVDGAKEELLPVSPPGEGLILDPIQKAIDEQKSEITNPELVVEKKNMEEPKLDEGEIPDFG